jgi:hypothetical protein
LFQAQAQQSFTFVKSLLPTILIAATLLPRFGIRVGEEAIEEKHSNWMLNDSSSGIKPSVHSKEVLALGREITSMAKEVSHDRHQRNRVKLRHIQQK